MFELTRDEQILRRFYEDEQQLPRWFQDGANNWGIGWDAFKAFCDRCAYIYNINNTSLVYAETMGNNANLHFSLLRGSPIRTAELNAVRDDLLAKYNVLFAYIGKHNRGLRKIVEQCGMTFSGVEMRKGHTRNKNFVWQLFTVDRKAIDLATKYS